MATVINTSDDLLKLLAENAEFYQAVRRLVLTDELIELPERFARFTAEVHDFITRQERFNERIETAVGELQETTARLETSTARLEISTARLETSMARLEISVGELKGNTARYVVDAQLDEIAERLDFKFKDTIPCHKEPSLNIGYAMAAKNE